MFLEDFSLTRKKFFYVLFKFLYPSIFNTPPIFLFRFVTKSNFVTDSVEDFAEIPCKQNFYKQVIFSAFLLILSS